MSNEGEIDPYEAARRAAREAGSHLDATSEATEAEDDALPLPKPSHLQEPSIPTSSAFADPTMGASAPAEEAANPSLPQRSDPQMIGSADTGSDFASAAAAALGASDAKPSIPAPNVPKPTIRTPVTTPKRPAARKGGATARLKAARDSVKSRLATRQAAANRVGSGGIIFGVILLLAGGFILLQAVASSTAWKDVQGLGGAGNQNAGGGNGLKRIQQVLLRDGGELRWKEAALNRYLARRLAVEKGGPFAGLSSDAQIGVDLKPNQATVLVKEVVFGRPVTYSVVISDAPSGKLPVTVKEMKTGNLPIGSAADALQNLAKALEEELVILKSAEDVRFEDGSAVVRGIRL